MYSSEPPAAPSYDYGDLDISNVDDLLAKYEYDYETDSDSEDSDPDDDNDEDPENDDNDDSPEEEALPSSD